MYSEDELIPLSSLQHYSFCPRQCALIHLEQQWEENRLTAEGRLQHARVDKPKYELHKGVQMEYSVPIRSFELGISGKADVVEVHKKTPFPVEHKRGRPKLDDCDRIQLCAQAICLEEMLGISVPNGAIFYGKPRRREVVEFTKKLRVKTRETAKSVHELIRFGKTPHPKKSKKCSSCSLYKICLPERKKNVSRYISEALE